MNNALLKDIARNPFDGKGKAEALKHKYRGYWSRRVDGGRFQNLRTQPPKNIAQKEWGSVTYFVTFVK